MNINFYKLDSWSFEEKLSCNLLCQYVYVPVSHLGSGDKDQHGVGKGACPLPSSFDLTFQGLGQARMNKEVRSLWGLHGSSNKLLWGKPSWVEMLGAQRPTEGLNVCDATGQESHRKTHFIE